MRFLNFDQIIISETLSKFLSKAGAIKAKISSGNFHPSSKGPPKALAMFNLKLMNPS